MTNLPELNVWRDHDGGPCPLPDGTWVNVKRRNGTLFFTTGGRSEDIDWSNVYSYYVINYYPDLCQHCGGTGKEPVPEPRTAALYGAFYVSAKRCVWSHERHHDNTHRITYQVDAEGNPVPGSAKGPEKL